MVRDSEHQAWVDSKKKVSNYDLYERKEPIKHSDPED